MLLCGRSFSESEVSSKKHQSGQCYKQPASFIWDGEWGGITRKIFSRFMSPTLPQCLQTPPFFALVPFQTKIWYSLDKVSLSFFLNNPTSNLKGGKAQHFPKIGSVFSGIYLERAAPHPTPETLSIAWIVLFYISSCAERAGRGKKPLTPRLKLLTQVIFYKRMSWQLWPMLSNVHLENVREGINEALFSREGGSGGASNPGRLFSPHLASTHVWREDKSKEGSKLKSRLPRRSVASQIQTHSSKISSFFF